MGWMGLQEGGMLSDEQGRHFCGACKGACICVTAEQFRRTMRRASARTQVATVCVRGACPRVSCVDREL